MFSNFLERQRNRKHAFPINQFLFSVRKCISFSFLFIFFFKIQKTGRFSTIKRNLKYDCIQVLWLVNCFGSDVWYVLIRVPCHNLLVITRFFFSGKFRHHVHCFFSWCFFSVVDDSEPEKTDATSSGDLQFLCSEFYDILDALVINFWT